MITSKPVCIIQRGKAKSEMLADLVAQGSGGCRVLYEEEGRGITEDETPVFIGVWPSTLGVLREMQRRNRAFVTVDNGYFKPYKSGGFFRATTNAMQWQHSERYISDRAKAAERYERLELETKPWASNPDGHVLIIEQSERWMDMFGAQGWAQATKERLKARGIRSIIRAKPTSKSGRQPDFFSQLRDCRAVVGFSSNALVEAAMQGYPVFPQAPCAASAFGRPDVEIDRAVHPHRPPLLHQLAANQWHLDEIASGQMWSELTARYDHYFPRLA